MRIPFHTIISHFPIALAFVLPALAIAFALLIKNEKMQAKTWLIIFALNLTTAVTGYVSIKSGVAEEPAMEKLIERKILQTHESVAEVFVGTVVICTLLSLTAFFIKKEFQFPLQLMSAGLGLVSIYFAYQTAILGGELVYKYGAASAYVQLSPLQGHGIEPHSSAGGVREVNESLKADDNDYGDANESNELEEDDDEKQED